MLPVHACEVGLKCFMTCGGLISCRPTPMSEHSIAREGSSRTFAAVTGTTTQETQKGLKG